MKTLTKFLLVLTVTGFVLGLLFVTDVIQVGDAVGWYMTLPAGAIFFGLFLITLMLEKEVAAFDQEQQLRQAIESEHKTVNAPAAEVRSDYSVKHAH